jgi:ABC-type methionine transport system ATPase subunit
MDALADVSFEVRRGEFVAVLGPSGAGKATLFRRFTPLTRPDAGSVVDDGCEVSSAEGREPRAARHDVALIFQQIYERNGHGTTGPGS